MRLQLEEAMNEIDTDESDGDSSVSLEMIVAWLKKLKLVVSTHATPLLRNASTPCLTSC